METTLGAKINCAQNNLYTYVLSDISKTEIWKLSEMHEKCNFLLRNLTPLQLLLCDVVWLCYGYSSGLRSNFKSFKSLYSNQIQKDTRACITEEKIEIEWGALQLLKIDLKWPITLANQYRIATGEVSKCAEENSAFHTFIFYSLTITVSDISDNMYCVQLHFVRSLHRYHTNVYGYQTQRPIKQIRYFH